MSGTIHEGLSTSKKVSSYGQGNVALFAEYVLRRPPLIHVDSSAESDASYDEQRVETTASRAFLRTLMSLSAYGEYKASIFYLQSPRATDTKRRDAGETLLRIADISRRDYASDRFSVRESANGNRKYKA